MVLFVNINVNQRVEVKMCGEIYSGTVKYKGPINGYGDWVGIALDQQVGKHDGMIKARRYFACKPGHGIFTTADKVRFMQTMRCVYNSYRSVERDPDLLVEEDLFGSPKPQVRNRSILNRSLTDITSFDADPYSPPKQHHLSHSISSTVPPATWFRPQSARTPRSTRMYYDYDSQDSDDDFITKPTIPQTHMPHSAMESQVTRGWDTPHVHYPRHFSVNTARDVIDRSLEEPYYEPESLLRRSPSASSLRRTPSAGSMRRSRSKSRESARSSRKFDQYIQDSEDYLMSGRITPRRSYSPGSKPFARSRSIERSRSFERSGSYGNVSRSRGYDSGWREHVPEMAY